MLGKKEKMELAALVEPSHKVGQAQHLGCAIRKREKTEVSSRT